jgi:hypothetical protein
MKKTRKLQLNKETLRALESMTVSRAAGAATEPESYNCPATYTCPCSEMSACGVDSCNSCHWYCIFTIAG